MAKLDLEWLTVFDEIYKTGSVSRAAERLGLAQATASIALSKLRLHFGDKLFSRTSKGMEPTPHAQKIYPELREVMALLEKARGVQNVFEPASTARDFLISITDISEIVLLPTLLNHLRRVAPKVHIETEKISLDSPRRLETGEVDLAVGFMPHLEAGFYQQTLFTQNFVCLAAKSHPRIGERIGKAAFLNEGHIVVTTSGTGHSIVDKMMAQHGIARDVVLRLPSFLGVGRIVAQTELLVIVPRLLGETLASQEAIKLLDPPIALPSFAVKQHWHDRFHADPGNVWLRRTMAELFSKGTRKRATDAPARTKRS
ncbi:LysR family transcriptional regulator [Noviherbaspirillum cavernae]|uniref:LysR family transcriptional regulator n=1 Tax=Noviherbaspirillum cavernae TaxID=2320862 RepID=A0A418X572_9BURK|nr:LysR family transcriptional regulator [Noviherbaspirillum cavernae]RJG07638.1 LysR family transcriptional regulator [Noviherbaspirillum cavernae]